MWLKINTHIRRYALAEICGMICALCVSLLFFNILENVALSSFLAASAEAAGFYAIMLRKEMLNCQAAKSPLNRQFGFLGVFQSIRSLCIEFGIPEVLDNFLIRPLTMMFFINLTGSLPLGILLGKFSADIVFYTLAVFFYEMKTHFKI